MAAPGTSFIVRWAALPFWPRLWREAAAHDGSWVLFPVILWALIAGVVVSVRTANIARASAYDFATYYEQNADPLRLEGGRFSLAGDRILQVGDPEGSSVVLIDP